MVLWAATWRSKILGSWGHHLSLTLRLRLLWWLLLGRRQGRVLGLMLVVGHPIRHQAIMLWLLVLLVVMVRVTVGVEVLL